MTSIDTYKILLLGAGGVGKTSFIRALMGKEFDKKYIMTMGVQVDPIRLQSSISYYLPDKEHWCANIWDCAGQEKFKGLGDGYYIQAQAAIFAFDLSDENSLSNLKSWVSECWRVTGNIPYVIVGMKSEIRKIPKEKVLKIIGCEASYVEISSKTGHNIDQPLLSLRRQLKRAAQANINPEPPRIKAVSPNLNIASIEQERIDRIGGELARSNL